MTRSGFSLGPAMNALPRMVKDSSNLLAVVAASLAGRDPRQALERWTTWGSEKPRSPQVPFSTPMPLHLAPPKGWWGASARWVLTHAVPPPRFSAHRTPPQNGRTAGRERG